MGWAHLVEQFFGRLHNHLSNVSSLNSRDEAHILRPVPLEPAVLTVVDQSAVPVHGTTHGAFTGACRVAVDCSAPLKRRCRLCQPPIHQALTVSSPSPRLCGGMTMHCSAMFRARYRGHLSFQSGRQSSFCQRGTSPSPAFFGSALPFNFSASRPMARPSSALVVKRSEWSYNHSEYLA